MRTSESDSGLHVKFYDNAIPVGVPGTAQDYHEEDIPTEQLLGLSAAVFLVRASGDSMEGARIFDGSIITVDKSEKAGHNKIIVGMINKEFTIKRLVKTYAGWVLHPENHAYTPYLIRPDDEFEVWGVVKKVINNAE